MLKCWSKLRGCHLHLISSSFFLSFFLGDSCFPHLKVQSTEGYVLPTHDTMCCSIIMQPLFMIWLIIGQDSTISAAALLLWFECEAFLLQPQLCIGVLGVASTLVSARSSALLAGGVSAWSFLGSLTFVCLIRRLDLRESFIHAPCTRASSWGPHQAERFRGQGYNEGTAPRSKLSRSTSTTVRFMLPAWINSDCRVDSALEPRSVTGAIVLIIKIN